MLAPGGCFGTERAPRADGLQDERADLSLGNLTRLPLMGEEVGPGNAVPFQS
jgi:hypothetical protein